MKPGYGLELVQTQKLILTPELRQAITILQMNALELRDYLREEVERNPLLELDDGPESTAEARDADETEEGLTQGLEENRDQGKEMDQDIEDGSIDDGEGQDKEDIQDEFIEYLGSLVDSFSPQESYRAKSQEAPAVYQNAAAKGVSLKEYLLSQVGVLDLTPSEYQVAEYIIGSVDDNGYLRSSVSEISFGTGQPKSLIEKMIAVVQNLDPKGVGARNLRECLLIQAKDRHISDLATDIIDSNLPDLARAGYKKIAQERKTTVKEVLKARNEILSLDPKPGAGFSSESVAYVIPDIIVRKVGQDLLVMLNDSAFPIIRWNAFYQRLMKELDGPTKSYLIGEYQKAKTLLRNIERRKATMSKVMDCVLRRQRGFFLKGPMHLEPLSLKDVADEIGVHESTVSRAISNKFVDTPFGVFSCKVFFKTGLRSQEGSISQYSVKEYVKDLIKNEDPKKPFSDEEISILLRAKGIKVQRRTVAKYRQELGISASNRRKKL